MRPEVAICAGPPHFTGSGRATRGADRRAPTRPGSSRTARHPTGSATRETRQAAALVMLRPVHAPPSRAAHQRRPSAGALTTPTMTSSSSMSPMRVAQTGTPADEVLGPVDRVDDPAALAGAGPAELLAEHRVPRTGPAEHVPQRLLDREVSVADGGQVRLGVHPQVHRPEPAHGDVVRGVRQDVCESKVAIKAAIPGNGSGKRAARPGQSLGRVVGASCRR